MNTFEETKPEVKMNTYETMKHNIPEGATHYCDENDDCKFSWFKKTGDQWHINCPEGKGKWIECTWLHEFNINQIPTNPTYRYEKVEFEEDWEYFKLMSEEGYLYVNCVDSTFEGCYGDNINLANAIHDGVDLYRRSEVTERELFISEFNKTTDEYFAFDASHVAGKLFDAGYRFVNGKG